MARCASLILLSICFISLALPVTCQKAEGVDVHFTDWYQGKPGAVSFTFDDAGYTQFSNAYPILERYSLKGTFSIVGEWVQAEPGMSAEPDHFQYLKMGWAQLLELTRRGHELAAHGYTHERYDKYAPVDSLADMMSQIKSLIAEHTGKPVLTMHYPYSYASGNIPLAAARAGYLFCRTGLDTVNPAHGADMHLLASMPVLNEDNPGPDTLSHWLEMARGNWLILMYHNFFLRDSREMELFRLHEVKYSYSVPPDKFEEQVLSVMKSGCWIAPVASVGKYITERDSTRIKVVEDKRKIIIITSTDLDTRLYDHPLTLEVKLPWRKVKIEGSCNDGVREVPDGNFLADIRPESVIIITKLK